MEVTLLGTGSADGWPNPFCTCASCDDARSRGDVRGQTAALVDDRLLIDCGPEVPRAALRLGRRLDAVTILLLTHAHPDHVGPQALLFRRWAQLPEPLTVVGPPAALDVCRPWVGPGDPVIWRPVVAGDVVVDSGYQVRVLAAAHDGPEYGPAVLYEVTDVDGVRLLYLTDTGPLPPPTLDALDGARAHLVLIEETFGDTHDHGTDHLDLATLPDQLAQLRARKALADRARVVAIHLSHHNPAVPELRRRLADLGADVVDDGTSLLVGPEGVTVRPPGQPAPVRRTLILGGARSGKSTLAERLAAGHPGVHYVATARIDGEDVEMQERIVQHRRRRPAHWTTTQTRDVAAILHDAGPGDLVLVDCFTLWLAAVLDDGGWDDAGCWLGSPDHLRKEVDELVTAWRTTRARVIGVSNEVGSGIVPDTASGRLFRDTQGRLNHALADASDETLLVVAGQVVRLSPAPGVGSRFETKDARR